MIDIQYQWVLQIDITNDCNRSCSNCTRLIGHVKEPFYMSVEDFTRAVQALKRFPINSPPASHVKEKMIGIIGGEPLMHPQFQLFAEIIEQEVQLRKHRGLWTGLKWQRTKFSSLIERVFGYVNNNQHNTECRHSPILVSISDLVKDPIERKRLIDDCWLQRMWAGAINPKGLFFCEVAAAMDVVFNGPGGLPVEPECWRRPLTDFKDQIDRWCNRCGIPLNLEGRKDCENVDDISPSNLKDLQDSPRIASGNYVLYNIESPLHKEQKPWQYLK